MTQYKADFASIPWESPLEGMRQKIHRIGDRRLRLVEYTKGLAPHWCDRGHIGYVLEGEMEIRFDHEVQLYAPGDGIFIPNGEAHRHMATILTDTVTVIFVEDT
ncbi:MAG: cupin domain-containing protein [Desulfomonile tiedjei]|nr:cupin domain-containing protein [Desulfomonile tiedjei]